ncbi:MAG: hypothetical protein IPK80_00255 [Nannocystis sp.]|nr:hypothetical protein [Nannocystis sp.]
MLTFLIAGINLVLGLAAVLGELQFLRERGLGYEAVAFGAVFLALGFAVRKGIDRRVDRDDHALRRRWDPRRGDVDQRGGPAADGGSCFA